MPRTHVTNAGTGPAALLALEHSAGAPPRVGAGDGRRVLAILHRFGRWSGILFEDDVAAGDSVALEVDAGVRSAAFLAREVTLPPRLPRDRDAARIGEDSLAIASSDRGAARLKDLRNAEIHSILGGARGMPIERAAWMWWHLDVNTHARLLEDRHHVILWPERIDAATVREREGSVRRVQELLTARANRHLLGGPPPHAGDLTPGFHFVACLVRRVLSAWSPDLERSRGGFRFADDCIAFAAGELELLVEAPEGADAGQRESVAALRRRMSRGQPDSIALVLLAELAIASIEVGLDAAWWSAALPAVVAMIEPFGLAYGSATAARMPATHYDDRLGRRPLESARSRSVHIADTLRCTDHEELVRRYADRLRAIVTGPL